jgi:dihydrofolate reductase
MINNRKLILYISMSLDGYIATEDNGLDFLSPMEQENEDYGYREFTETVDTVIIGRKSYDKVLEMGYEYPHRDKEVYIITHTERPASGSFLFYTGNLPELVRELKLREGKNIYCDGGAEIANILMNENLIDEYIISVIPTLLGSGIPLFKPGRPEQKLNLISSKQFEKGLVQLKFEIND